MSTSTTEVYLDKDAHVKPFLGIPAANTSEDTLFDLLIPMASQKLNDVLNVDTLAKATYTDERVDGGTRVIELKNFPVLSVTSIKQGSNESLYTQTESYILERNRIELSGTAGGGKGYEQNKVTYVAGYVTYSQNDTGGAFEGAGITLPDTLLEACLLLVAGMYNKRKSIAVKTFTVQGKSVTFRDKEEFDEFNSLVRHFMKPTRNKSVAI